MPSERFDKTLRFFLALFLVLVPLTRFAWDLWAQQLLLLLVILAVLITSLHLTVSQKAFPKLPFELILFLFFYGLSSLHSSFKEAARTDGTVLAACLGAFFLARLLTARSSIVLEKVLLSITVVLSFLFIAANLSLGTGIQQEGTEFFLNESVVASITLMGLFLTADLYFQFENLMKTPAPGSALFFVIPEYRCRKSLLFVAVSLMLLLAAFALCRSFAATVGLLFGCTIALACLKKFSAAAKRIALLLGISLILAIGAYKLGLGGRSVLHRAQWYSAAFQMFLNHPLGGNGPGSFELNSAFNSDGRFRSIYLHSFPLQLLVESGLATTALLFIFWIRNLISGSRIFLVCGLSAILCQALFDFSLNVPGVALFFWFILGLLKPADFLSLEGKIIKNSLLGVGLLSLIFVAWQWGIKPLVAFNYSLSAQESFDRMNLVSAEAELRKSIRWDAVPAKYYAGLGKVLLTRYENEKSKELLETAIQAQQEALKREPLNKNYELELKRMLKSAHL